VILGWLMGDGIVEPWAVRCRFIFRKSVFLLTLRMSAGNREFAHGDLGGS